MEPLRGQGKHAEGQERRGSNTCEAQQGLGRGCQLGCGTLSPPGMLWGSQDSPLQQIPLDNPGTETWHQHSSPVQASSGTTEVLASRDGRRVSSPPTQSPFREAEQMSALLFWCLLLMFPSAGA